MRKYTVSKKEVLDGLTVPYRMAFPDKNNTTFAVDYEGKRYFLLDSYCMNPVCKCEDVNFTLYNGGPAQKLDDTGLDFKLSFKSKKATLINEGWFSRQQAEAIVKEAISDNLKETIDICQARYKEMKQAGKEILGQDSINHAFAGKEEPKINRNAPCPCGSGKKYKKCCGSNG